MALNSSKIKGNNGDRPEQPQIDAGVYPARILQIIDLGLQQQRPYQGKEKAPANEIMLTYELVDCFMVDEEGNELEDKPRLVSETLPLYNVAVADKAKCTQRYKAADPDNVYGGDFSQIVGTPVNVSIVLNKKDDKVYTNIAAIAGMRPRDADKCPDLKNPVKVFDLDNPDMEIYNNFPDWIKEKIANNLNYNGSPLQEAIEGKPKKEEPKKAKPKKEEIADEEEHLWD